MPHLPERRFISDRRQKERADDLHRRLEEKRQQIERRRRVRRQADRSNLLDDDRSEADDQPHAPDREEETQPPSHE